MDCSGECNGDLVFDSWNHCCLETDIDDCGMCNGDNAYIDCTGLCFGDAYVNECMYCIEGTTGFKDINGLNGEFAGAYGQDCNQDCAGKAYDCFDINVMGTLNLINSALKKNVKQFIFASSEWVYNDFKMDEEQDETSLININKHTSEYALSKLVTEANLMQQYERVFNSVTILLFGIIYGPRKNNWSAVESIFSQVKKHEKITINSKRNGNVTSVLVLSNDDDVILSTDKGRVIRCAAKEIRIAKI